MVSFFVARRTDRDERDSDYNFKPCYNEIQAQVGFSGDGHIVYGKETNWATTINPALTVSDSYLFFIRLKLLITCGDKHCYYLPNHHSLRAPYVHYQQLGSWIRYFGAT